MTTLTEAERAQWDVDPEQWLHTPPFHVFAALMDEDDNTWWRAGSGHGLNAYDAAREQIDALAARLASVKALHVQDDREGHDECVGCRDECLYCEGDHVWPCPTIRAVLGSDAHTEQKGTGR